MSQSREISEKYTVSKYLTLLTEEHLRIPGVTLFGFQSRISATESLPSHEHGDCFEIVYICSGNPVFETGGKSYTLSGGDVFITYPHEIHSSNFMPVTVSEMYWLQLDLSFAEHALFLDRIALETLVEKLNALSSRVIRMEPKKSKNLLSDAFRTAVRVSNPQLVAQYISLFLFLLLEESEKSEHRCTPDIARTVSHIQNHLDQQLSLDYLAGIAYLSTSQFKQKFMRQMGVSPRQFINSQKIQLAEELLQGGYSTSEVAAYLHFENASYFITVFKRYTSCTPGEYKKRHLKP